MKLNQHELEFIKSNYLNGVSINNISFHTGLSINAIKRALHETGIIYLSWNKSTEEDNIIRYLADKGITTLWELKCHL